MPASTMELRCLLLFGEVPGLIEWLASDAPPADTYDLLRVAENMQTLAFACWHCVRLNNKLPPKHGVGGSVPLQLFHMAGNGQGMQQD